MAIIWIFSLKLSATITLHSKGGAVKGQDQEIEGFRETDVKDV